MDGALENPMLAAALGYVGRGWHVFPCHPEAKHPMTARGAKDASNDAQQVRSWWESCPTANIGLALKQSGLVAIDADTYKPDCGWASFIRGHELPDTLVQRSANGGTHYIFEAPHDCRFPGKLCDGVDIKHNGHIVLEPSIVNGGQYRFETDDEPAPAPDWVPRRKERPEHGMSGTGRSCDIGELKQLLRERQNTIKSRDDWVRLIHALRYTGGDELREAFVEWSYRWPDTRPGDPEHKWDTCRPDGDVAAGTAFQMLREQPIRLELAAVGFEVEASGSDRRDRGPASKGGRSSRFFSAAELAGRAVPPREWLVPDWVPMKNVTLFMGDGGTGKSLLALQLAASVATEANWIGRGVRPGRVILLSAEDDEDELHRRLADILRSIGKTFGDLSRLTLRSLAGEDALLAIETKIKLMQSELFEELDQRAESENPALIVLDTLADVYPANENDRAKVRQFIGILRGLAIRRKCAVLLLGHPSLTGMASGTGASGSTAWNNSVRSRLYLTRIADDGYEPDPDARILTKMKANYGRVGDEIAVEWRAGVFHATQAPSGSDRIAAGAKAERVFLKLLDAFSEQGRYVSANPSSAYAPSQFARHPEAEGCTKAALTTAMNALFGRDEIGIAQHGKGAKARSHIARVEKGLD